MGLLQSVFGARQPTFVPRDHDLAHIFGAKTFDEKLRAFEKRFGLYDPAREATKSRQAAAQTEAVNRLRAFCLALRGLDSGICDLLFTAQAHATAFIVSDREPRVDDNHVVCVRKIISEAKRQASLVYLTGFRSYGDDLSSLPVRKKIAEIARYLIGQAVVLID
jgi:hypothetical protein